MDAGFYTEWANAIRTCGAADFIPFPRAPLYPYLLALMQSIFGDGWLWPRLFNLICDGLSITLIYLTAKRLAGNLAARFAATLFVLSGASIYYSGEALMTSLATMLMIVIIYLIVTTEKNYRRTEVIFSGVALGLLILLRPNALALLPVTALSIYYVSRNFQLKPITSSLLHVVASLVILAPVTIVNYLHSGEFIPVSTQGGVNFYIGNARGADGWSSDLPGVGPAWLDEDARLLAERKAGRSLNPMEVSDIFWRLGWREIGADPAGRIALIGKKALMLLSIKEIGNNRPLLLPRLAAPFMSVLLLVSLGLIFPISALGIVRSWKLKPVQIITILSLVYAASLLLFFVNSRYRMPLLPASCILAGIGLIELLSAYKRRETVHIISGLLIVSALLAWPSWLPDEFESEPQAYFVAGNASLRAGQTVRALQEYGKVADLQPSYPELHLNRGVALLRRGDSTSAIEAFRKELVYNPANVRALNNLGVIFEGNGNLMSAMEMYRQAYLLQPHYADARLNLGKILLRHGDLKFEGTEFEQAGQLYREAASVLFDDPRPVFRQALIAASRGDLSLARSLADSTLSLDVNYPPVNRWLEMNGLRKSP